MASTRSHRGMFFAQDREERLEELRQKRAEAGDPTTTPERLRALVGNSDHERRDVLAGNPNTPLDILLRLAWKHPDAVLRNPAWSLWLMADPELPRRMNARVAISFGRSPEASPELLRQLAWSRSVPPVVRGAVASNPNCPLDLLDWLRTQAMDVRVGAARNRHAKPEWLRKLAGDRKSNVREAVAGNPSTPPDCLTSLARSTRFFNVRLAAAGNPSTPSIALRVLSISESRHIAGALAENPSSPPEVRERALIVLKVRSGAGCFGSGKSNSFVYFPALAGTGK